jgi:hypothetical protein
MAPDGEVVDGQSADHASPSRAKEPAITSTSCSRARPVSPLQRGVLRKFADESK